MNIASLPSLEELVPHRGISLLLDRLLDYDGTTTTCLVDVGKQRWMKNTDGSVPSWLTLEYMAQCIAAHAGMHAHRRGEVPRIGFLLGSRRVDIHQAWMQGTLGVRAQRNWGDESGLVSFDCALWEEPAGTPVASGRLNCFLPSDAELKEMPR